MLAAMIVAAAMMPRIKVDTDPENMLATDEPVRLFHDETKERFDLYDMVVVGVVNEQHEHGVFNPDSLSRIKELTDYAATLQWPDKDDPNQMRGVIKVDIIAPSMVDHIGQGGPGTVSFEWLMPNAPKTQQQALELRRKAMSNPMLEGTMVSEDGQALTIYLPLTSKDMSYKVYSALKDKIAQFDGDDQFHITGLPVAEDTFGVEMFIQMAISAPLAMLTIFILMLLFFRKLVLIISPMIIAMASVIITMGLMIGLGYPVHIMSSMIPIFLMPIAVVDSVHILSEFFDRYTPHKGRHKTIMEVMDNLFVPMLYTSLTSAAGFASLALTPIPPVQVFGIFVAFGIMAAWLLTVTFVPAYVMMINEKSLEGFGLAAHHEDSDSPLSKLLKKCGMFTYKSAKPILAVLVLLAVIAGYGISQIRINDNPVKWFTKTHPIRVADRVLNDHFGGTYMAYLVLEGPQEFEADAEYIKAVNNRLDQMVQSKKQDYPELPAVTEQFKAKINSLADQVSSANNFIEKLDGYVQNKIDTANDQQYWAWAELGGFVGVQKQRFGVFKRPEVLGYISGLQKHLEDIGVVGKSNSVADIVKKINQELISGDKKDYRIPDSLPGVAENLMQYQNSHRPGDLWHMVTPDYKQANVWLQLKSGDNRDMQKVTKATNAYFEQNPPPIKIKHRWAGLTYINVVWQDKMVWGMLQSFMGSFLVVFIMMSILFRSPLWGIISMIPLSVTILLIYGIIGLIGKDYDMPVAVLSALTLGMAVDFAIHFLQRARATYQQTGSWKASIEEMFNEPARAISRNVLVIAIGFLPLLAAPLMPYKTVGVLLCAIMAISGTITLVALSPILKIGEKYFFASKLKTMSPTCNCGFCIVVSIAAVVLIVLSLHQYWQMGLTALTWFSVIAVPVLIISCGIISRRRACKTQETK